jgi:hypothetical protein
MVNVSIKPLNCIKSGCWHNMLEIIGLDPCVEIKLSVQKEIRLKENVDI